jgi:rhodanese-related sulfurtransferase
MRDAQLRDRVEEADALLSDGPLYLYCRVGFTSYMAYRILHQRGYDQVYSLAGGTYTFMLYHRNKLVTGKPPEPFWSHAEMRVIEREVVRA